MDTLSECPFIGKSAVKLFDYIHSLDNERLASKISQYQKELNKDVKSFFKNKLEPEYNLYIYHGYKGIKH